MNIDAIGALGAALAEGPPAVSATGSAGAAASLGGFDDLVTRGLAEVNTRLNAADTALQGLALGEAGSLHQVMIKIEESDIAMRFLMQVRTRALDAYQEMTRMQV